MHIEVRFGAGERTEALHEWMWGVRDGESRRCHVRDIGVYQMEDEGGVEEDTGDKVGVTEGRHSGCG